MEKSMDFGKRIKHHRKRLGLSQEALSIKSGISSPSISDYENNKVIPRRENLEKLAQVLGVPIEEFLQVEASEEKLINQYPDLRKYFDFYSSSFVYVPILGKIHAGNPNQIPENLIIGGVNLPIEIAKGVDYALKVTGMSMKEEGISEGDLVLVRLQKYAENGQVCVARVDSENYVIKHFRRKDMQIWLESANAVYEPITENFEVIGIIMGLVKKFK